jgi:hypothetical protein
MEGNAWDLIERLSRYLLLALVSIFFSFGWGEAECTWYVGH